MKDQNSAAPEQNAATCSTGNQDLASTAIFNLPREIFLLIIEFLMVSLRARNSLQLRLVNKVFAREILDAFFQLDIIRLDAKTSSTPRLLNKSVLMCPRIMSKYLMHKFETDPTSRTCYATEIRQTTSWLMREHGDADEVQRLKYTNTLCTAAATISGSRLLSRHMTLEFRSQPVYVPNDVSHCVLTALAYLGDFSRLRSLIDAGVDINAGSQVMGQPLQAAAARGHTVIGRLLLENGADANGESSKYDVTPLKLACFAGHKEFVQLLLDSKHGLERWGVRYDLAAMGAVRGDNVDLMQLLMRINETRLSLQGQMLQEAAAYGAVNIVRTFLDEGVSMNIRDTQWRTPIQMAASKGYEETVRVLIARGADRNQSFPSPIYQAAKHGYERIVQILHDAGDGIHHEEEGGPLTAAAKHEKIHMVQFLLKTGIDSHAKSIQTALNCAAGQGYERIVRILAAHGADLDYDDQRAMLLASMFGHDHVVKTLLEFGAQPIDLSKCKYAAKFATGEYPKRRPFRY